jgi:hypothetical protein
MKHILPRIILLALLAAAPVVRAQITFTNIADSSSPTYSSFDAPSINSGGTLGFFANLDGGGQGLYTSNGTTTTTIALTSDPFYSFFGSSPSINTAGTLGFHAFRDAGGGRPIYERWDDDQDHRPG